MKKTSLRKSSKKMTRSIVGKMLTVCALTLTSTQLHAQKGFEFGINTIVQVSSIANNTDGAAGSELDYVNKVHMGYGVTVGYGISNHVGIETGLLYSRQGQAYIGAPENISATDEGIFCNTIRSLAAYNGIELSNTTNKIQGASKYTASVELSCIKIPLLFRVTSNPEKRAYFSMFAGPQFNLLTGAKYTVNNTEASFAKQGLQTTDAYNKTTFDGVLGLGLGVNLSGHVSLTAHLRLDYGLSDVENKGATFGDGANHANYYSTKREASHNATGGLLVGLKYSFGKPNGYSYN